MSINFELINQRDNQISFDPVLHKYTIKDVNVPFTSVTTLVHKYAQEFDSLAIVKKIKNRETGKYAGMSDQQIIDSWSMNGKQSAELGTIMHEQIENYFLHKTMPKDITPEFSQFLEFVVHNPELQPFRLEWRIWDPIGIAGSVDAVMKCGDDYYIYDWKRSKEIKLRNPFQNCKRCLSHLEDCNYNHYTLQLNIYKYILEKYYGLPIKGMFIVVCHPDAQSYNIYELQNRQVEIQDMIKESWPTKN
jgi:ATP-dependent exoDNAse (exonuclease V) beta subunit